jgi:hypothetical protein
MVCIRGQLRVGSSGMGCLFLSGCLIEFVRGEMASKHRSPSPILAKTAKSVKSGMTAMTGAAPDGARQSMEGSSSNCSAARRSRGPSA